MTDKPTAERILQAFSAISLTIIKNTAGEDILRRLTPLSGLQKDISVTKIDQSHLSEIERLIENISKHCYLPKRGDGLLRGVELTGAVPVRYRRVQRFRLLHSRRRP